jgi:TPR repeat protein
LFNRAASAGDVAAVVAMGTTYDPAVLGSRGVHGILADPQKARGWYEKAAQSGSTEGLRLLKALESRPDALRQTAEQTDPDASLAINRDLGRATQRDLLTRRQPVQYYKPRH